MRRQKELSTFRKYNQVNIKRFRHHTHCRVLILTPALDTILSQANPVHIPKSYFSKMQLITFHDLLTSIPRGFQDAFLNSHIWATCPAHRIPRFGYPINYEVLRFVIFSVPNFISYVHIYFWALYFQKIDITLSSLSVRRVMQP